MTEKNRFRLVACECSAMHYLEHAFKLLQISYSICTPDQFAKQHSSSTPVNAIGLCQHQLATISKQLGKSAFPILCVYEEDKDKPATMPTVLALKAPFTIYELKHDLLKIQSFDHDEHANDPLLKNLIGESAPIKKIKSMIKQVAISDSNILILGQSGTGKEVIASCIHQLSNRKNKPFVPLNCGAIPSELMESELFGHEKGAFTGAVTKHSGRFEIANFGTLFLDEIGDMPLPMQVKLLRVLQDGKISRVGSTVNIDVNVRLVAATNRNLEDMIAHNTFREDLYYRLNVIPIYVPTLHERMSDIPLLVNHQLETIRKRIPHESIFSESALQAMAEYEWPGNIRELSNFVERMVVLCSEKVIEDTDIIEQLTRMKSKQHQFVIPQDIENINMKEYLAKIEQQIINIALEKSNGIVSAAAEYLNLGRTTLIEKMKKYKLLAAE